MVASDESSCCWGGDGLCGGLEDGHQETKGVPLEGRCGNALPWRMLPLTDYTRLRQMDLHFAGVGMGRVVA